MSLFKILSLDLSSTCTGYTKYEYDTVKDNIKVLQVDSIKPKSTLNFYQRLKVIDDKFKQEDLYQWPDFVAIESYAFGGKALTSLAELNGIIKYNFHINGDKPIEVIAPTSVKKLVTNNGKATKELVQETLLNLKEFKNITFKNLDESDSSAVGLALIYKIRRNK